MMNGLDIIVGQFSYHTPYQPEIAISVQGWYGVGYENCHEV